MAALTASVASACMSARITWAPWLVDSSSNYGWRVKWNTMDVGSLREDIPAHNISAIFSPGCFFMMVHSFTFILSRLYCSLPSSGGWKALYSGVWLVVRYTVMCTKKVRLEIRSLPYALEVEHTCDIIQSEAARHFVASACPHNRRSRSMTHNGFPTEG